MLLLFSTSLSGTLKWLQGRYLVAALLGAVFGPLSYVAGGRLGAIEFNQDFLPTVLVLAVVWGLVVPLLAWLANRMVTKKILPKAE